MCYSFGLALPAVLGYAAARRVRLVGREVVCWKWSPHQPFLFLGLSGAEVAVLPSDPLAASPVPGVKVVADDAALLAELRASLVDAHLAPLLERIRAGMRVSGRTFWGSLASGVAHGR